MSELPLFRPEAVAHRLDAQFGDVLIHQAPRLAGWSAAALLLVILLLGIFLRMPFKQTVPVRGVLMTTQGPVRVFSPATGVVLDLEVREGQRVEEGQRLLGIRHPQHDREGQAVMTAELAELAEQRMRFQLRERLVHQELALRLQALKQRMEAQRQALGGLLEQQQLLEQRQEIAERDLLRQQTLHARGQIADVRLEQARDVVLQLRQTHSGLQDERLQREAAVLELEQERSLAPLRRDRELLEIESSLASLDRNSRELLLESEFSLTAPVAGEINNLLLHTGAAVDARIPVLDILPADSVLEAQLYVPSRALGDLRAGQEVLLALDALPFRLHGHLRAVVTHVPDIVLDPREQRFPPEVQEPVYLVRASLPDARQGLNEANPLRAGMGFTAHVITGRQTLSERMLSPLQRMGERLWR